MRRRARTDRNHSAVAQALRQTGYLVVDMSAVGGGFPDLLALRAGRVRFIEVKDGGKTVSKRPLTVAQKELHAAFLAAGVPIEIVLSAEQAVMP